MVLLQSLWKGPNHCWNYMESGSESATYVLWVHKEEFNKPYLFRTFSKHNHNKIRISMLPSRSALSDLCLIADLFEKMLTNWSSFCFKSPLFGLKSPKSLIFTFWSFHTKPKITWYFANIDFFQIKVDLRNVRIRYLEQVWFWPQK